MEASFSVGFEVNTPPETEGWAEVWSEDKWIVINGFSISTPSNAVGAIYVETCEGKIETLIEMEPGRGGDFTLDQPICVKRIWFMGITTELIQQHSSVNFAINYELVEKPVEGWKVGMALAGLAGLAGIAYLAKKRRIGR